MLIENPRYSRIALGIPGLFLLILVVMYLGAGALWIFYTWIAFLIVLGTTLLVKGFGIDKAAMRLLRWTREFEPSPLPVQIAGFAFAAGIIAAAVGIFLGINGAVELVGIPPADLSGWLSLLIDKFASLMGAFIKQGIYLIIIGICVLFSGRAIRWYFERDYRLLRTLVIIVVIAWSSQIFSQVSLILLDPTMRWAELVFTIFIGILLAIATSLIAIVISIKYGGFFKKRKKKVQDLQQG